MANDPTRQPDHLSEEVAESPGARTAAVHQNPELMQAEARNAAAGEGPNAAGGPGTPSDAEDYVPSSSDPEATDLPTANAPNPR
ncbi:MAG: hypothetical protein ACFCVD_20575 [Nodosilinea sp.]